LELPKSKRRKEKKIVSAGMIVLFNDLGRRIAVRRYADSGVRLSVLRFWKKEYGYRFNSFYYHIIPDEDF
jgi:hypothetical protein